MLKLLDPRACEKVKAENVECNPHPAIIVNVSSIAPPKRFGNMETKVRFEEEFQGRQRTQFYAAFSGKQPKNCWEQIQHLESGFHCYCVNANSLSWPVGNRNDDVLDVHSLT